MYSFENTGSYISLMYQRFHCEQGRKYTTNQRAVEMQPLQQWVYLSVAASKSSRNMNTFGNEQYREGYFSVRSW
jgi:hypothetical protein